MRKRGFFWIAVIFITLAVIMPKTGMCEEQQKQVKESKNIYDIKPLIKQEEEIANEEKQLKLLEIKVQKKKCEREIREIEAQMQEIEATTGEQAGSVYQRRKIKRSKEGEDVNWLSKAYLKMMFKKQNVNYAMISFNERDITVKEGDNFEGYKVEKITTDCVVLKAGKITERISW